jgi:hypothetical protein
MSSSGPASSCESRIVVREAEVRRRTYGSMPQVVPASKRERCLPQLMAQGDRRAAASAQQGENPSSLRRHACCATSRASPLHLCVVRRTHLRTAAAPPRDATETLIPVVILFCFPFISPPRTPATTRSSPLFPLLTGRTTPSTFESLSAQLWKKITVSTTLAGRHQRSTPLGGPGVPPVVHRLRGPVHGDEKLVASWAAQAGLGIDVLGRSLPKSDKVLITPCIWIDESVVNKKELKLNCCNFNLMTTSMI